LARGVDVSNLSFTADGRNADSAALTTGGRFQAVRLASTFPSEIAACAAASLAIGTL
jgi:hypothetical protein